MSAEPQRDELARVVVIGSSCSGKTTFASRLAQTMGQPHVELDALYWGPRWTARPPTEFRALVAGAVLSNRWVVDGNYSPIHDLVWPRATSLVWLNYTFPRVFARAIQRSVRRAVRGEILYSGNRETLRRSFCSRESILWWIITTYRSRRRAHGELLQTDAARHMRVHMFTRPRDADSFLSSIEQSNTPFHAVAP
jgi:adenylate kinase family enzyme